MKSFLVIGMGRFGSQLASKLIQMDNEVMVVDKDPEVIERVASSFTDAQIGNCTHPTARFPVARHQYFRGVLRHHRRKLPILA